MDRSWKNSSPCENHENERMIKLYLSKNYKRDMIYSEEAVGSRQLIKETL